MLAYTNNAPTSKTLTAFGVREGECIHVENNGDHSDIGDTKQPEVPGWGACPKRNARRAVRHEQTIPIDARYEGGGT